MRRPEIVAGAFNTTNLETTIGILSAVEESGLPAFIQVAPTNITFSGYRYIYDMVNRYAETMMTPVALHLDHGRTLADVRGALAADFTAVMLDASNDTYEENVEISAAAKQLCPAGVALEAELGTIGGKEDDVEPDRAAMTDPTKVADFVARTGCDMLAVSVGNVHGYAPNAAIDFELLAQIHQLSPVPLVLHGASGLHAEALGQLSEHGVVKVNIASDLRNAHITAYGQAYAENPAENHLIKVAEQAVRAVHDVVLAKTHLLNPKGVRV